jgi:hypothetical protein
MNTLTYRVEYRKKGEEKVRVRDVKVANTDRASVSVAFNKFWREVSKYGVDKKNSEIIDIYSIP